MEPEFCVNQNCKFHAPQVCADYNAKHPKERWYYHWGWYTTKKSGIVPRYCCRHCSKTSSSQTFDISYYAKKEPDLLLQYKAMNNGGGICMTSRDTHHHANTIGNWNARMARQCIAIDHEQKNHLTLTESLAFDGFEPFVYSQYFPAHQLHLVGVESQFTYYWDYTPLRRKGRMTEKQKQKRKQLDIRYPIDREGVRKSITTMAEVINTLFDNSSLEKLILRSDNHNQYPKGLKINQKIKIRLQQGIYVHEKYSSRLCRDVGNPLFSVNYIDREKRKDQASYARETVQCAKNVNDQMNRDVLYHFYHNYEKPYRIRGCPINPEDGLPETHATMAGIPRLCRKSPGTIDFRKRRFLSQLPNLTEAERKTWLRLWRTPGRVCSAPVPKYAYM